MVYTHEFKKRHAKDPYGYPVEHLIRTLVLNSFNGTPSPVGPKTKSHNKRVALLAQQDQILMDADTLDEQDDNR